MPEHLKALIVILALATAVFAFARKPACALAMLEDDFVRRRNLWFAVTLIVFLAHSFWIYILVAGILLLLAGATEKNRLALFYLLLFAAPPIGSEISGLGGIRYFFEIDYLRLLSLSLLLPAALMLHQREESTGSTSGKAEKLLTAYLILNLVLQLNVDTFTNTLRKAFLFLIDVVLPFYVASRTLKNLEDFRGALTSFSVAAMILAVIGMFEFARHWLLYSPLEAALGVSWGYGGYLERDDTLRALGSTGQPIALGFVMAVAIGIYMFVQRSFARPAVRLTGLAVLLGGLIASLSRGPWIGAVVAVLIFIGSGPRAMSRFSILAVVGAIALAILMSTPMGEKAISYLPFVGSVEEENITYRQRLIAFSVTIILANPFFGSYDFMLFLEEMRQGQGIIDLVNSYLSIALTSGLVGLSLFVSIFGVILFGVAQAMRSLDKSDELHLLGRVLLATMSAVLVIIFTVSSITVIPVIYWSIAGVGVAYIGMLRKSAAPPGSGKS